MFPTVSASVAGACARYLEHDVDGALDELLTIWADVRNPELADVIEALIASRPREPLRSPTRKARRAEWVDMVERRDPLDLPRLMDSLTTFLCGDATKLLEWLAEQRPNPVLASRLLGLVLEPPDNYQGQRQVKFWDRLVSVMRASADPRAREPVLGEVARLKKIDSSYNGLSAVQARVLPRLIEYLGSLDGLETALSKQELEACRHLTARLKARDDAVAKDRAEALLQEVYAAPGDDDLRMVLADALTEIGDDRGELIVIQMREAHGAKLSREMRRRQRELLTMYGRTWLGPIEPALQKSELAYRRGFPVKGRVQEYQVPDLEVVLARPEWTTFEELDVSRLGKPGALVLRRDMTQLRRVFGMNAEVFECEHELPIVTLSLRVDGLPWRQSVMARCRALPHLRHLDAHRDSENVSPERLEVILADGGFGSKLVSLEVVDMGSWLAACQERSFPFEKLTMHATRDSPFEGVLTRDEAGRLSRLTIRQIRRAPTSDLRFALRGGFDNVRSVEYRTQHRLTDRQRDTIERLLREGKNMESITFVDGEG